MKKELLFALSLLLFYSCNSDSGTDYSAYYEKQQADEYEAFHKGDSITQHLELVDTIIEMSIEDSQKEVFVVEYLEGKMIVLGDSSNFYLVSIDQVLDDRQMRFTHEVKLNDVRSVSDSPLDSLPHNYDASTGGVYRLKELRKEMQQEICNNEFILVFRTTLKTLPKAHGDSFEPGIYTGRILMYSSISKELVANIQVVAMSSSTVNVLESSESSNLEDDFFEQVNNAYQTALRSKFVVKGYLPKLYNSLVY
ncbi:MAG: hypothetical protein ACI837_003085 [Crocinitomicaceae bacterium]|jgi:hypothetical protein